MLCASRFSSLVRFCRRRVVYCRGCVYVDVTCAQERPYHSDSTASRPLCEVKHCRARLVLRWGTTLESRVLFFCRNQLHNTLLSPFSVRAVLDPQLFRLTTNYNRYNDNQQQPNTHTILRRQNTAKSSQVMHACMQTPPTCINGTCISDFEFRDALHFRYYRTPPNIVMVVELNFSTAHGREYKKGGLVIIQRQDEIRQSSHPIYSPLATKQKEGKQIDVEGYILDQRICMPN